MNGIVLKDMLGRIAERGRALVEKRSLRLAGFASRAGASNAASEPIEDMCRALLSGRGEATGVALAGKVLDRYAAMSKPERQAFFQSLARDFGPDPQQLKKAWAAYEQASDAGGLQALLRAVEPPRQELFRRLNLAPGGTGALVALRAYAPRREGGFGRAALCKDALGGVALGAGPRWNFTDKLAFEARFQALASSPSSDDRFWYREIGVRYRPVNNVAIRMGYSDMDYRPAKLSEGDSPVHVRVYGPFLGVDFPF